MDYGYDVYVQIDSSSRITAINSSAFITDFSSWVLLESNVQGDKGHHAQGNYLPKPLMTMQGVYQYKHDATNPMGQQAVERTSEEMQADIVAIPAPPPTTDEVVEELITLLITQGVITNV